jgi:DNA-binding transcriptional LysR family regulator
MLRTLTITAVQLDFNLLRALDVLLDEGSVGGAADRLHLSQAAMSRTLARIRKATGDGILVRSGRAMVPTPYAVAVRNQVHALVEQVQSVLTPAHDLVLDQLDTTFTLRCHDTATNALAPGLVQRVRSEAPGVRLRFLAETDADDDGLRSGRTDIEIGSGSGSASDIASTLLGSERLSVAMRAGHPLSGQTLTTHRYVGAEHITISRRGRLEDPVDGLLRDRGLTRRVVASAPTSTSALRIVRDTDAVTAVPEVFSATDIQSLGLVTAPFPFDLPEVPVAMRWHTRNENDPAHRWLRGIVTELLGG